MTLSSPKRLAIEKRMAPRAALLSGLALALGLSANGAAHATLPSSASYTVESQAFASGGVQATSSGYSLSGTVGQSSALGAGSSASYALAPGFQSTLDGDGDDYPNHLDAFPSDPTEWVDTDGDTIGNNADTDDDNDGMPDAYENLYIGQLDPLVEDAAGDVDDDGFSNLEEYIAGTDPTDATSLPLHVADFNGDFMSDILYRHNSDGRIVIWQMNGFDKEDSSVIDQLPLTWKVIEVGDLDDNARSDIVWYNNTDGRVVIWLMDGFLKVDSDLIDTVSSNWEVKGLGDFDGDGFRDILWRNRVSGMIVIWQMNGLTRLGSSGVGTVPLNWQIKGVADFNGDDRADIVFHNVNDGRIVVWQMNFVDDVYVTEATPTVGKPPTIWQIEGISDFNGGGQPDLMFRNSSDGRVVIWLMNGYDLDSSAMIEPVSGAWRAVRAGDHNGGGQADILWHRAADGQVVVWQMNGLVKEDSRAVGSPFGWTPQ